MIFLVHNHGTREDWNIFEHLLTNFSQGCDSSKIAFDTSNYTFISSIMWHRSSTNLCFDMPFQWWQKCRWSPDRWRRRRFVLACVANCIFPSVPCNFREPHLSPTWSPGCTDTLAWFGCTAFSRQIIKWTPTKLFDMPARGPSNFPSTKDFTNAENGSSKLAVGKPFAEFQRPSWKPTWSWQCRSSPFQSCHCAIPSNSPNWP